MRRIAIATLVLLFGMAMPAWAAEDSRALEEKLETLTERVQELEAEAEAEAEEEEEAASIAAWTRRVRLGGSFNGGFYGGESDTFFDPDSFLVWDSRFFIDASLGEDVELAGVTLVEDAGFTFEWDLVRLGRLRNRVGEAYADFRGIGGSGWLNMQIGRFQLPVGENYLRFSRGYADNPFISNTVGGPWYWDEGIRLFGSDETNRVGYVASVSDGDTPFNTDSNSDKQFTLKLFANPTDWLHVSVSGLRSDKTGSASSPAAGALWLGESFARAFGAGSGLPNYHNGVAVADGPNVLKDTWFVGADAVVDLPDCLRLWVAYGYYDIDSTGSSIYDRSLQYWVAELILRGSSLSPQLAPLYVGVRANALATYDKNEGYLLDVRYGSSLGYNMKSLTAYSGVVGWNLTNWISLRAEYTHQDIALVRGASALKGSANGNDYYGLEVGIHF